MSPTGEDNAPIEVRDLCKIYPGTMALDRLSLAFPAGRISALIGKNGAGKSTLVKILSGVVRPSSGEIVQAGRAVAWRSPNEALLHGIATVHQELSLIPGLTVGENILIGRFPRRRGLLRAAIDRRALYARADEILRGMQVRLDVRCAVARLSPAQRQMVEIARAMSFDARVVLLDEPTAGLARAEVESLFALMRTLAERGVAILYVTHRMSELGEIADSVTALRDGRHAGTMPAREATPEWMAAAMYDDSLPRDGVAPAPVAAGISGDSLRNDTAPARGQQAPAGSGSSGGAVVSPAPSPRRPLLDVRRLGLENRLFDVDLMLGEGEILGIAGMLGSGRTELLMCLFGAIRADNGRISIHAHRPDSTNSRREPSTVEASSATPARMKRFGLAMIPEDRKVHGLVLGLSALDNACLASLDRIGRAGILTRRRQRRAIEPLFDALAVQAPDLDAPVSALSGGNQQKVVIAKWLNSRPRIVLFDEPTRGIDLEAKHQVFDIIRKLSREGVGSIVVSSDLEELPEICDRILVMRRGRIVDELLPAGLSMERLLAQCL